MTRRAAYESGERLYCTGRPCKRGHISERYVSSGQCVQCMTFKGPPKTAINANNMHYPPRPLEFPYGVSVEHAQKAYLYIEANGWLRAAAEAVGTVPADATVAVPLDSTVNPR